MPLTLIDSKVQSLEAELQTYKKVKTSYNGAIENARTFMVLAKDEPSILNSFWQELEAMKANGVQVVDVPNTTIPEPSRTEEVEQIEEIEEAEDTATNAHPAETGAVPDFSILQSFTCDQLRNLAGKLKVKTTKMMNKSQLIGVITQVPKKQIDRFISKV